MREIKLYVHIPFCVRKCYYCDFLSAPSDAATRERYVKALCNEIISSGSLLKEYEVSSVFFGGGTPSLLSKEEISNVVDAINMVAKLSTECEITVECNPGTVNQKLLETYHSMGINRLSFGLQSAKNEELKTLGRIHTYEQFVNNYKLARTCGFTNINVDIMSALPKQTLASYEETLHSVIALMPEHISAYSLIIEEETEFFGLYGKDGSKQGEVPSVELDRLMYERSKLILQEAGYERYEISNYAKPSYECSHNIGYWRRTEYLGFGLGASSLYQGQRFANEVNLETYMKEYSNEYSNEYRNEGKVPPRVIKESQVLTTKEEMEEFMFLGLRMCQGVSKQQFLQNFQVSMETIYGSKIKKLIKENVLEIDDDRVKLTDYGIDVSNVVLAEFLL